MRFCLLSCSVSLHSRNQPRLAPRPRHARPRDHRTTFVETAGSNGAWIFACEHVLTKAYSGRHAYTRAAHAKIAALSCSVLIYLPDSLKTVGVKGSHETAQVYHPPRRRSCGVADRGTRAAGSDACR